MIYKFRITRQWIGLPLSSVLDEEIDVLSEFHNEDVAQMTYALIQVQTIGSGRYTYALEKYDAGGWHRIR